MVEVLVKRDDEGTRVLTLKESLARYMDPEAFRDSVPDAVKFTCGNVGKSKHDKLKRRRTFATERAGAAIRFFKMPHNRERLDASIVPAPPSAPKTVEQG
jgi:hypothetical protein